MTWHDIEQDGNPGAWARAWLLYRYDQQLVVDLAEYSNQGVWFVTRVTPNMQATTYPLAEPLAWMPLERPEVPERKVGWS